jgi:hypothetical protein
MSVPKMVNNGQNSVFAFENMAATRRRTPKLEIQEPLSRLKEEQKPFLD